MKISDISDSDSQTLENVGHQNITPKFHNTFGREKQRKKFTPHFCRVAALTFLYTRRNGNTGLKLSIEIEIFKLENAKPRIEVSIEIDFCDRRALWGLNSFRSLPRNRLGAENSLPKQRGRNPCELKIGLAKSSCPIRTKNSLTLEPPSTG